MTVVTVKQAYRFALDPAPAQERMLRSHAGAARFAWNWALARCGQRYVAEGRWYSAVDLHKLWNAEKKADPALAWWDQNSKCVYQEAFRDLDRRLANGTARILSATISRIAHRWLVSFTVEVQRAIPVTHARPGSAIGLDLGVKTLLTGVDDVGRVITIPGPQPLRRSLRRLHRASRAHSRKKPRSASRRRSAARLARLHAHVANIRADALHKATTSHAARYQTIAAEDLNVAGMTGNRRLARAKLTLAERVFTCESCGLVLDRDVNAARNLLKLAASGAESITACGGMVRPGLAGRVPVNQEPGATPVGKTGTAARQQAAADQEPTHAH